MASDTDLDHVICSISINVEGCLSLVGRNKDDNEKQNGENCKDNLKKQNVKNLNRISEKQNCKIDKNNNDEQKVECDNEVVGKLNGGTFQNIDPKKGESGKELIAKQNDEDKEYIVKQKSNEVIGKHSGENDIEKQNSESKQIILNGNSIEKQISRNGNHEIQIIKNDHENADTQIDKNDTSLTFKSLVCLLSNGSKLYNNIDVDKLTVINLNNCTLGKVPEVLQRLELKELYLSNIGLKTIPLCLYSGLETLEILDMSCNELENFDVEPRCATTLKRLYLQKNKLENVPQWILNFRAHELEELDYSFNRVKDLTCLQNNYSCLCNKDLFKLKSLTMVNCSLNRLDKRFLKNIATLEKLDISNDDEYTTRANRIVDIESLFVRFEWIGLRVLNLNNMSLSVVPEGITWLASLSELYLAKNYLSYLPAEMEYFVYLEILDVSDNELTFFPQSFFMLQNVRMIKAANNRLTDFGDVSNMKHLEILDLYKNKLEEFCDFPESIKMLDLECNWTDTRDCAFYDSYVVKKDMYRKTFNSARLDGFSTKPVHLPSSSESETSKYSSISDLSEVSFEQGEINGEICVNIEKESWNENGHEEHENNEKHPDVTPSDDEWSGDVPHTYYSRRIPLPSSRRRIRKPQDPFKNNHKNLAVFYDRMTYYDEGWLFCDADVVFEY